MTLLLRLLFIFATLLAFSSHAISSHLPTLQHCTFHLRVSSLQPLPDNSGASPQAIATPLELKVLPEQFSGIYTPEVAVKSPSAGAKGVGFWSRIGDWFNGTVETVQKDPIQAAWFGLGFVPILGGAIDCAKGAVNLITNSDVDLVETELGCAGMSFDALSSAVAIATLCGNCATYAIVKPVLIAARWANKISQSVKGALTRAFKNFLKKLTPTTFVTFFDDLKELGFLSKMFTAGDTAALKSSDNLIENIVKIGCTIPIPLPKTKLDARADNPCNEDNVIFLVKRVAEGAESAGYENSDALDAILKTTGDSSGGKYIKGAEKNVIKLSQVPINTGEDAKTLSGIYYESKVAFDNLQLSSLEVLEMGKEDFVRPIGFGKLDADVYSKVKSFDPEKYPTGIDYLFDEVKTSVTWIKDKESQILKYIAYAQQQASIIGQVTGIRYIFNAKSPLEAKGILKRSLCYTAEAARMWFIARIENTYGASYVKIDCSSLTEF
jgi:hypothetical protein